jgi:Ulp1 family protease
MRSNRRRATAILYEVGPSWFAQIGKREIDILENRDAWVNDEIVHFGLMHVANDFSISGKSRIWVVKSFTLNSSESPKGGRDRNVRSKNERDTGDSLASSEWLVFPCSTGNHWLLAIVHLDFARKCTVYMFDSYGNEQTQSDYAKRIRTYLVRENLVDHRRGQPVASSSGIENAKGDDEDAGSWYHVHYVPVKKQHDSVSCGLHVIANCAAFFSHVFGSDDAVDKRELDSFMESTDISDDMCLRVRRMMLEAVQRACESLQVSL